MKKRMEKYIKIKYQAEKVNEAPAKDILDYYEAPGLPAYVILEPKQEK